MHQSQSLTYRTKMSVYFAVAAVAAAMLAPSSASAVTTHPEVLYNFTGRPTEERPKPYLSWGSLKITTRPETAKASEVECMSVLWGGLWNAGAVPRGHGVVLGWTDSGHLPSTAFPTPKLSEPTAAKCRWVDEGVLVSPALEIYATAEEATTEDKHKPLSTPWRLELRCQLNEEGLDEAVVKMGIPYEKVNGEPWPESSESCATGAEEQAEVEAQEAAGLRVAKKLANAESVTVMEEEEAACYDPIMATHATALLRGCVKIDAVQPAFSAELPLLGSLRLQMQNGFGSGLNPSHLVFQGQKPAGGALYREASPGERIRAFASGGLVLTGEENVELITAR